MLTPLQNLQHRSKLLRDKAREDQRIVMRNITMRFAVSGVNAKGEREFIGWYGWYCETKIRLLDILRVVGNLGFEDVTYTLWFTCQYAPHDDYLPHEDVTDLVRTINLGK